MRGFPFTRSKPQPALLLAPETATWQDLAATTPAVANNDPVSLWIDYFNATSPFQGTAANRPLVKTNQINGYRALLFDGANDTLAAAMTVAASQTWFLVAKKASAVPAGSEDVLLGLRINSSSRMRLTCNGTQAPGHYAYFPNEAVGYTDVGGDPTQWNVISLTATAAAATVRCGGGAGVTLDPFDNIASCAVYSLCTDNSSATTAGDFYIAEVRRYLSVLSLADHDLVGNELAKKYALGWSAAA